MGRLETPSLLVREKISQNFAHAKIGIGELPAVGIGEIGILAPALVVSPSCGRPYPEEIPPGELDEVAGECRGVPQYGSTCTMNSTKPYCRAVKCIQYKVLVDEYRD